MLSAEYVLCSENMTIFGAESICHRMQQLYGLEGDRVVASWEMLLHSGEKLADAVIVATQDKVGAQG